MTNKITGQIYVGSTRNDLESQWKKMLAAASQNLDYPLYDEIRSYGHNNFQVEEWDFTTNRSELAQLEREALETLNAKSLKGYKTSTVKIQPKKKTRQRKPIIEKELTSLLTELLTENTHVEGITPSAISTTKTPKKQTIAQEKSQEKMVAKPTSINLAPDMTVPVGSTEPPIDMSVSNSSSVTTVLPEIQPAPTEESALATKPTTRTTIKVTNKQCQKRLNSTVKLSPKEKIIHDAIERHRRIRAEKSSEAMIKEKDNIASLLMDLETKARYLSSMTLTVAA